MIMDRDVALKKIIIALFFFLSGVITSQFVATYWMPLEANNELSAVLFVLFVMLVIIYWNKKLHRINMKLDEANTKLANLSETDGLTQLKNRHFMSQRLPKLISVANRSHSSMAVAMLDIDNFKDLNDSYGHAVGDDCLIAFSQLIKMVFKRESDCLIRFGDEEFLVVCFGIKQEQLAVLLEQLRFSVEALTVPINTEEDTEQENNRVGFTISSGYTFCSLAPNHSIEKLLLLADQHLYQAKENGRNRIVGFKFETI